MDFQKPSGRLEGPELEFDNVFDFTGLVLNVDARFMVDDNCSDSLFFSGD